MNLKSKSKFFCIVINEKAPNELEAISESIQAFNIFTFYALIIHDKDTDSNGNLKTRHLHIYGEKVSQIALETLLNELCDCLGVEKSQVSIDKTSNNFLYLQYLTHKNDQNKHQYDIAEVVTNNEAEFLSRYNQTYREKLTEEEITNHLRHDMTLTDLIQNIGLDNTKRFLTIYNQMRKDQLETMTENQIKTRILELRECINEIYNLVYENCGYTTTEKLENILLKYNLK